MNFDICENFFKKKLDEKFINKVFKKNLLQIYFFFTNTFIDFL